MKCVLMLLNHRTDHNVYIPQPITVVHTGQRSCLLKIIDLAYLKEATATSHNIKLTKLVQVLGIHRNMLHIYIKKHGIKHTHSTSSNAELDQLIRQFKAKCPESGLHYTMGHLYAEGRRVQYHHILQSLWRIGHICQVLQDCQIKRWCKYYAKRPNALWHIDGHHKLICWGIIQ